MEKKKITSGALMLSLLLLLLLCSSSAYADTELTPPLPGALTYIDIGVGKAHEMLEKNHAQIILLDVRTRREYDAGYIPSATNINIPLSELESRISELDKGKITIVYCQSGSRSRTASGTLAEHGFSVYNLEGGIEAWKVEFPTSTSTPAPSLSPAVTGTGTPAVAVTPTPSYSPSPTHAVSPAVAPALSPVPSPSFPSHTPTPASTPTPGKWDLPGFEAVFTAAVITLVMVYLIYLRKNNRRR